MRMFTKALDIDGPAGRLEAVLMTPETTPSATAVLCHAHPLHGGMMHFKVLFRVAKALQSQGYAVLRFNFRGVGRSEGTHDEGRGEQNDVRAAIDVVARQYPGLPVVVGGFSFGSVMALRVGVDDPRVTALIVLGLPIERLKSAAFATSSTKPRLFVQGELDEFGSGDAMERFVATLPPPRSLAVILGADHFFTGKTDELVAAVTGWPELSGDEPNELI
jgi:alpha/beta superfamily hydrolase